MISRRAWFGVLGVGLIMPRARLFRLQAIAAAHMPHQLTIRSSDPRVAEHFAKGSVFEVRDYACGSRLLLFDSAESRWKSRIDERATPTAISLYRPA